MKKHLPLLAGASFIAAILAASIALGSQHSVEEAAHAPDSESLEEHISEDNTTETDHEEEVKEEQH